MANDKMNIQFRIKAVDNFTKNMRKLSRQLDNIERKAKDLDTIENIKVSVTGDKKALRDLERVEDKAEDVGRQSVWVTVKTTALDAWNNYKNTMGKIATFSRNVGELVRSQMMSSFILLAPTAVSGIASIAGVLGGLLPVIGTVGGGVLGLGSAFSAAGAGAVGFGAIAVSALSDVFEANDEIKKIREELAETDDLEERAELQEELAAVVSKLSDEQKKALDSVQDLGKAWDELTTSLEPQVVQTFTTILGVLESVLKRLNPMFTNVADLAVEMAEALELNIESDDVNDFFDFLNESAAPILGDLTKAAGNFAVGFSSMMTAFSPLASEMSAGLNEMAEGFREWAAGLSESERFNAFIDYVSENGPKILDIVGNIVGALVGMGEAFAPFASEMLDAFSNMTQEFEDWANALSENPAFQEFIDYVAEQGPNFLAVMGELRDLIINLAKGFAEVAEVMNPVLESVFGFFNTILEGNPHLAEFVAWVITILGAFGSVLPTLLLLRSVFGSHILQYLLAVTNMTTFMGALKFLGTYVLKAIGTLVRFVNVFGLIVAAVLFVAGIVKENWDSIYNWTMDTFRKISNFITEKWEQIKNKFNEALDFIDRITNGKFKGITDTIRDWLDTASNIIERVLEFIKDTFDNALRFLKAVLDGNFGEMASIVSQQMLNIFGYISDIWGEVINFLKGIDLYQIGKDIIQGLIRGISAMSGGLVSKVTSVVGGAIGAAKRLLRINSPSRVFMELGEGTGEGFMIGMERMANVIKRTSSAVFGGSIPNSVGGSHFASGYVSRDFGGSSRSPGSTGNQSGGSRQEIINVTTPVYVNGRQLAKATHRDVTKQQERKERLNKIFEEGAV